MAGTSCMYTVYCVNLAALKRILLYNYTYVVRISNANKLCLYSEDLTFSVGCRYLGIESECPHRLVI